MGSEVWFWPICRKKFTWVSRAVWEVGMFEMVNSLWGIGLALDNIRHRHFLHLGVLGVMCFKGVAFVRHGVGGVWRRRLWLE